MFIISFLFKRSRDMYLAFKNIKNNKLFSVILLMAFFISFLSISISALL
ncbi:ABC transporter permease, partial [Bacillus sp. GMa5/2]